MPSWYRSLTWKLGLKVIRVEGSQAGVHLPVPLTLKRRDTLGHNVPGVLQSTSSSPSSSPVVQGGTLPTNLNQSRSITVSRFVLNMVKGHHLQFRWHCLLCHNFKWFIIKAAMAHHPIIQEEVEKMLAKGAIEPSTGSAGIPGVHPTGR